MFFPSIWIYMYARNAHFSSSLKFTDYHPEHARTDNQAAPEIRRYALARLAERADIAELGFILI